MTTPRRIRLRRTTGWRMPPNTTSVARPTRYGNPFVIADPRDQLGAFTVIHRRKDKTITATYGGFTNEYDATEFAVELHWRHLEAAFTRNPTIRTDHLQPLVGRNLGCWCNPDWPCHADTLLALCERYTNEQTGHP